MLLRHRVVAKWDQSATLARSGGGGGQFNVFTAIRRASELAADSPAF